MRLDTLNPPQAEAVRTTEGPVLVLAGAGSGKTRVITHRIAYLLHRGVAPQAILSVTFTNKAATEMRERAVALAGRKAGEVTLSTFHAFGAEVLRTHITKLGWPKRFAVADQGDQMAMVRRALKEHRIDERAFDARRVLALISKAKNSGVPPEPKPEGQGDDYDLAAHVAYPAYQLALKAQGAVDFDDLLVLPSVLFEQFPKVRAAYQDRFKYLMVDEYQDTNAAQLRLLVALAGDRRNVFVVGDDDQAIYSWRGADVKNILEFEKHFGGAKVIRLEQNYRSTQVILDAANAVIALNPSRRDKRMWTDKKVGPLLETVATPDENEEAAFVAREIRLALDGGLRPRNLAVLYRTNGQSRPVEEALRERNIPYEVVGGSEFFDKREVKDVLAYLRAVVNPRDDVALLRILNVPARGIGDTSTERLLVHAQATHASVWEVLKQASSLDTLPRGAGDKVQAFVDLIEGARAEFGRGALADSTRRLLERLEFSQHVASQTTSTEALRRKVGAIDDLVGSLSAYEKREGARADLLTYLNRLALNDREEEDAVKGDVVTLATLHAAKGLEWNTVFLVGMEEDLLPHGGMQGEAQNIEEERRLAYVGLTRARERLVLTRAVMRVKRGKEVPRTPSRFLEDIPSTARQERDLGARPTGPVLPSEVSFFGSLRERLREKAAAAPGATTTTAALDLTKPPPV